MMSDDNGRRPPIPTATIPFPPRQLSHRPLDIAEESVRRTIDTDAPPARKLTEIEETAIWVDGMRHRYLKKMCRDITGDDEAASKLIDQIATWAEATIELAKKEGAVR